jgi:hypothetical protein
VGEIGLLLPQVFCKGGKRFGICGGFVIHGEIPFCESMGDFISVSSAKNLQNAENLFKNSNNCLIFSGLYDKMKIRKLRFRRKEEGSGYAESYGKRKRNVSIYLQGDE